MENFSDDSSEVLKEIRADLNMFSIATVHGDVRDLGKPDLDRLMFAGLIEPSKGPQSYQMTEAGERLLNGISLKTDSGSSI